MENMKAYAVDVPVRVMIWKRPECQKKQFEVIRAARPSIIFLVSDGGRNDEEKALIEENRHYVESHIDWECKVYKHYNDENKGLYTTMKDGCEIIWDKVDYCIFLEDDDIPAVSYFGFAAEVFRKYENDPRIAGICPINIMQDYEEPSADYIFSEYFLGWGCGLWKRTYDLYYDRAFGQDPYTMKLLEYHTRNHPSMKKRVKGYAENEYYDGHIPFTEFYAQFAVYSQHQLMIVPKKSQLGNIGYLDGTHTTSIETVPKASRPSLLAKPMEMTLPLTHPRYVMTDPEYEKRIRDVLGCGPFDQQLRAVERRYLYLKNGGSLTEGVKKVIKRNRMKNQDYED